jgi:hypothetical protein
VSCPTSTSCLAVGVDDATSEYRTEIWDGQAWSAGPELYHPGQRESALLSVSCVTSHDCVAGGDIATENPNTNIERALIEVWDGRGWHRSVAASTPSPDATALEAVACAPHACRAIGETGADALIERN